MKRLLLGWVGVLLAGAALAAGPGGVRKRVEASMLVTGTIEVAPDGTVRRYTLDRQDRLPPVVTDVIGKNVRRWAFEPVLRDGKPVAAKAKMSLRLVARPLGDGDFEVGIRGAYFGERSSDVKGHLEPPRYPPAAVRARVAGTVYLLLRIDRAGRVDDAVARQVNLAVVASDTVLQRWRRLFAGACVEAARGWTFNPAAPDDERAYRIVRVPVAYHLHRWGADDRDTYGQWEGYVPGPLEPAPWFDARRMLTVGVDALPADGGIYGKPSLVLRTPLDRG